MQPIIEATISSCSSPACQVEWGAGGGVGGERGSGAVCRLCTVGVRKLNKDPIPRVEGGGDFGDKQNSPPSNYLRSEGWERNVDSKDLGRTGAMMPCTRAWHFFMYRMWRWEAERGVPKGLKGKRQSVPFN